MNKIEYSKNLFLNELRFSITISNEFSKIELRLDSKQCLPRFK